MINKVLFICWFPFWKENDGTTTVFSKHLKEFSAKHKYVIVIEKKPFSLSKRKEICKKYGLDSLFRIYPLKLTFFQVIKKTLYALKINPPYFLLKPFNCSFFSKNIINRKIKKIQPDVIEAEYIWVFSFLKKYFNNNQKTLKIIQTYDIQNIFSTDLEKDQKIMFKVDQKDELKILNMFDIIVGISIPDVQYFKHFLPNKRIIYLPSFAVEKTNQIIKSSHSTFNFCFVGGSASFNSKSISWFIYKIFLPYFSNGKYKLNIYGTVCSTVPDYPNIINHGYIKEAKRIYEDNDLLIYPTNQIGGLKTKNVEALLYGTPVLTTTIGARGIEGAIKENVLFVANSVEEFVSKIQFIKTNMPNPAKCQKVAAKLFGKENIDSFYSTIQEAIIDH